MAMGGIERLDAADVPVGTEVRVNGELISHVTTVFPYQGRVIALDLGPEGQPRLEGAFPSGYMGFIKREHCGKVTLEFPLPGMRGQNHGL